MRNLAVVLTLLLLSLSPASAEDPKGGASPPKRPPLVGIRWENDFQAGLDKAARTGRPILVAINALEDERANNQLAAVAYRSKAWGDASRPYVAFVCNPGEHKGSGPASCTRYPGCTCTAHQEALAWFLARFGEELISPQHVILEPDGDTAFRKEYYTGVVGPALFDTYLSKVSPKLAYAQAAAQRGSQIKSLVRAEPDAFPEMARAWLASGDGLAAAGLLNVLDEAQDPSRRLAVIAALAETPDLQVPVLALAAEERVLWPTDEPDETRRWIRTLFRADRRYGVWAATRTLVRVDGDADREQVLRLWAGKPETGGTVGIADLPAAERSAAYEALLLAGDARGGVATPPTDWIEGRDAEIRRARLRAGQKPAQAPKALAAALARPHPALLRRRILEAERTEISENQSALVTLLAESPWFRVRVAAALRLLETQHAAGGAVAALVLQALDDPIEGAEARRRAIEILGEDPGQNPEEWKRRLHARVNGGAK